MLRPRFSLLSLLLLSLVCAAGMGVYWRSAAWVVEREIRTSSESAVYSAAVSPDGNYILPKVSETHFECRDRSGRKLWGPVEGRVQYARVSPDNRWIFIEKEDPNCEEIYDLASGKRVQVIPTRGRGRLSISPNGKFVFSAGMACWTAENARTLFHSEFRNLMLCFPSDEYLAELKRVQIISAADAHAATDLISYCRALNGPRESIIENDIERLSEILEKLDEPGGLDRDDPRLSYDYALYCAASISADGSTVVTQFTAPHTQDVHAALWHADTLQRICRLAIPTGYSVNALSYHGDRAILLSNKGNRLRVVSLPDMEILHQSEGPKEFNRNEEHTYITADGTHLIEVFTRHEGSEIDFQTRVTHLSSGRMYVNPKEHIERTELTPDRQRFIANSNSLNDFETSALLFEFKADDADASPRSIVAILDDDHVLTDSDSPSLLIWKRVRPEWWWGHFWLWETHALIVFSLAFFWSLLYRLRPRAKASTSAASVITAA